MTSALATAGTLPRPRAERIVRRCLFVREARPRSTAEAQRLFSVAMVISGTRCLLSYIVLPFLAPALGAATGIEPYFGIPISIIALVFDVRGMRRFWIADHRYRWPMTVIYLAVMGLVTALLVSDIHRLVR
ncbi:MAG TPA: hypothetical protein VIJ34_05795 [Acidimicrobiales bacterium]